MRYNLPSLHGEQIKKGKLPNIAPTFETTLLKHEATLFMSVSQAANNSTYAQGTKSFSSTACLFALSHGASFLYSPPMLLHQAIHHYILSLQAAGAESPSLAVRVLTAHVLGCTKSDLVLRGRETMQLQTAATIEKLLRRYASGEPLAYIIGKKEFYGRSFDVNSATLIPRPETEEVLEAAMAALAKRSTALVNFADIGTGSGCIALTLAAERPHWYGCMLDISPAALAVASGNARTLGVHERVQPVLADLHCLPLAPSSLDLLISNPPYVSGPEYKSLAPGVRDHEPMQALTPDPEEMTGLEHLEAIAKQSHALLRPGGVCIVEHGHKQGADVLALFKKYAFWSEARTGLDMAQHARFCLCVKE